MEEQNDYFIIEKSSNGREYKEIDRVKGHGTTTCITNYKTIDLQPQTGNNYYRDLINASSTSLSITFGTATGSFRLYSDGVSRWHQW